MKKSLVLLITIFLSGSATAAVALEGYTTPENKLIVAGLQPGKLYGVFATTPRNGVGVKNFTSNACGEVIIEPANIFQTITINRQKLLIKNLPVKNQTNCTQTLPPAIKPK